MFLNTFLERWEGKYMNLYCPLKQKYCLLFVNGINNVLKLSVDS